ncbi:FAD-dependent oxidoreductase [Candidatus Gottesmanbacteria bacterium]|nr:FAD-dependent oxidoreductase [Candidatus Gottesmanbacteria bacterium]
MRVAIIGGGFTGLTAAYELGKQGHDVTVFEKEKEIGGLAVGFRQKGWDWHLEKAYHHLFTNDISVLRLLRDLGLEDKLIIKRPITAILMPKIQNREKGKNSSASELNQIFQLDSPKHLLTFPYLSPVDKVRTAILFTFLKLNPFWQPLENVTAEPFFKTIGGSTSWRILWEPLMAGKFGELAPTIAASWLAARIKKRTPRLCSIEGGFQTLVTALAGAIKKNHGKILINTSVTSVPLDKFDKFLITVPTPIAARLVKFPTSYIQPLLKIPHLHAQTLILETTKPILKDVYWLNIADRSFPFLAVVAHTNFMDKKHYGSRHLTYFGNYLPQDHPYLSMTKPQILKIFLPFIKRLIRNSSIVIHNSYLFSAPFAQPVHQRHYSKIAPTIQTPIPHLYLANLDSIYPWDRGTNYAVELGQRAAREIQKRTLYGR